ncbi:hypothetical protein AUR04nite_00080 [Glutamicibacter uratoxydans]|uniref:Uncharacterized protein n=1 Tax=Glutamicibacter uratoxydans TaxID=43667 RepID=A0A4Y4DHD5_GLUUR|nr:hypothetical protein [Glutamicibacter uratoxydans]GED04476.1 hypothetical protein AUR04nite_00080 [Glutamicibacter uratoxydans]
MDFERKIKWIEHEAKDALDKLESIKADLVEAQTKTEKLLAIAESVGVTVISIGKKHPAIDSTGDFPFGASGSIFTPLDDRHNGWPAAWHIAEKAGVSQGGGNSGQHQADTSKLVDGVYELRNGNWARIDLED